VVTLDGRLVESDTIGVWAGAHALTIVTTLPESGLEFELASAFVGHEGVPTHATHLVLGAPGQHPSISIEEYDSEGLDPGIRMKDCLHEHIEIMRAHLTRLSYEVTVGDAFDALQRVEH
jgi:hypothetical protein